MLLLDENVLRCFMFDVDTWRAKAKHKRVVMQVRMWQGAAIESFYETQLTVSL
jgi:hypothetical protein